MTELDPFQAEEHMPKLHVPVTGSMSGSIGSCSVNGADQRPPRSGSTMEKHKLEPKCMLKVKTSQDIRNP